MRCRWDSTWLQHRKLGHPWTECHFRGTRMYGWFSISTTMAGQWWKLIVVITYSGWWFGTFFIFPYIGNNHPNWLIFFRGVAQPPTSNDSCWLLGWTMVNTIFDVGFTLAAIHLPWLGMVSGNLVAHRSLVEFTISFRTVWVKIGHPQSKYTIIIQIDYNRLYKTDLVLQVYNFYRSRRKRSQELHREILDLLVFWWFIQFRQRSTHTR